MCVCCVGRDVCVCFMGRDVCVGSGVCCVGRGVCVCLCVCARVCVRARDTKHPLTAPDAGGQAEREAMARVCAQNRPVAPGRAHVWRRHLGGGTDGTANVWMNVVCLF